MVENEKFANFAAAVTAVNNFGIIGEKPYTCKKHTLAKKGEVNSLLRAKGNFEFKFIFKGRFLLHVEMRECFLTLTYV